MQQQPGSAESAQQPAGRPHLTTLVLMVGLAVLTLNMFVPSLFNIASDLSASYGLVTLAIAGYLGITAVLQLVLGPLSDRFGRRPVMLGGLVVFCLASIGCALATNVYVFLFFRFLQAAVAAGSVVSPAVIRDLYPADEAASRLGYVSMAMALAPMLGPVVGGLLDEAFGWRSNFVFMAVAGFVVFAICWVDLAETNTGKSTSLVEQVKSYPKILGARRFWGYALCSAFSVGAFYVFITGAPLVAESVLNISPAWLGVYIGSISAGFALGSFLSGRFARRMGIDRMVLIGRIVAGAGLALGLTACLAGHVSVLSVFGATIFVGLGNGLTIPSSNAGVLSVRPALAGSAAGMSASLAVAIGGVLTLLAGAVIQGVDAAIIMLALMLCVTLLALLAARVAAISVKAD